MSRMRFMTFFFSSALRIGIWYFFISAKSTTQDKKAKNLQFNIFFLFSFKLKLISSSFSRILRKIFFVCTALHPHWLNRLLTHSRHCLHNRWRQFWGKSFKFASSFEDFFRIRKERNLKCKISPLLWWVFWWNNFG